ncbi:MAG: hypothetical protein JNL74_16210 [Fibrobacteres bacterium]|nr:hypothetical protein [Fibrobacterota bacterium]
MLHNVWRTIILLISVSQLLCGELELVRKYSFSQSVIISEPSAISFAADGGFYISVPSTGRVFRYDTSAVLLSSASGNGTDRMERPSGLARGRGFALYAADADGRKLFRLSDDLTQISSFDVEAVSGNSHFHPFAASVSKEGLLYVADETEGYILTVRQDGTAEPFFRQTSSRSVHNFKATAIAAFRNIYVSDKNTGRIHVFDRFGSSVAVFGDSIFAAPHGMAFIDSTLYVADQHTSALISFSKEGQPIDTFHISVDGASVLPGAISAERERLLVVHSGRREAAVYKVKTQSK